MSKKIVPVSASKDGSRKAHVRTIEARDRIQKVQSRSSLNVPQFLEMKSGFAEMFSVADLKREKRLNGTVTESFLLASHYLDFEEYVYSLNDLNDLILSWDNKFKVEHVEYMRNVLSGLDPESYLSEGSQRMVFDTGHGSVYKFAKSYAGLVANYRELEGTSQIHDFMHKDLKIHNAKTWSTSKGLCLIEMEKVDGEETFNHGSDEIVRQSMLVNNKFVCYDFGGFDDGYHPEATSWLKKINSKRKESYVV